MGKFSGCLLASDADGTLFGGDGVIHKRTIDGIKRFVAEGGLFVVASGRTADAVRVFKDNLAINAPCALANGSQLYDFETENIVWQRSLSPDELAAAESVFRSGKFKNSGTELHSGKKVYVFSPTPESTELEIREGLDTVICANSEIGTVKDVFKALITMHTEEEFDGMERFIKENAKCELNIAHSSSKFGDVDYHYLEVLPLGVNKSVALEELCRIKKIERKNVFAIGDYYNDLEMLQFAGIRAVPAASPEDIKNMADYVVCDCTLGAVGNFIELLEEKYE